MKKFKYFIQFFFVIVFFILFKLLGPHISSKLGGKIFEVIGPFFRSKKVIHTNIKKAIPEINSKNLKKITNSMWNNYGKIFAEYMFIKNFRRGNLSSKIKINGKEILDEIIKNNKQVVFISGHICNFELMAMYLEKSGINLAAIYRPLNNIYLNPLMEKIRKNYICKNQIKKGRSGTRQIIENLNKGNSVALMIDQRVREGIKTNFFGKEASTTTIPAQLIRKYKCDLVPIYIERRNKYYFKMFVSEPIKIGSDKSINEITEHLNKILEKMILKNIDQWIWTHDRWKK